MRRRTKTVTLCVSLSSPGTARDTPKRNPISVKCAGVKTVYVVDWRGNRQRPTFTLRGIKGSPCFCQTKGRPPLSLRVSSVSTPKIDGKSVTAHRLEKVKRTFISTLTSTT